MSYIYWLLTDNSIYRIPEYLEYKSNVFYMQFSKIERFGKGRGWYYKDKQMWSTWRNKRIDRNRIVCSWIKDELLPVNRFIINYFDV